MIGGRYVVFFSALYESNELAASLIWNECRIFLRKENHPVPFDCELDYCTSYASVDLPNVN